MSGLRSLKDATKELIERVGGFESAANFCRVQSTTLQRYTSENAEYADRFITVDVVEALEQEAGEAIVTEYLAEKAHCLLWEMPSQEVGGNSLSTSVIETGEHVAQLFKDWAKFLEDGVIDADEAEELLVHNRTLVRTLMRMRTDLEEKITTQDD